MINESLLPELKLIETSSIYIPLIRQRTESPPALLKELTEDLRKPHGLLHPIVVQDTSKTPLGYEFSLVAGCRRLQAIRELELQHEVYKFGEQSIPPKFIPAHVLPSDLTTDQIAEAELSENTARLNLSWQDVIRARAELHRLRTSQNPDWKLKDSGKELHIGPRYVSESVIIAEHLDNKIVASAPSLKRARKYIFRKLEHEFIAELHASGVTLDHKEPQHELIEGNAFEELPKISAEIFDCIISDPPFGVDIERNRGSERLKHDYEDSIPASDLAYYHLFKEGFRVAKPNAHLYAFCAITRWPSLFDLAKECNWDPWFLPLIWWKGPSGRATQPLRGPKLTYEAILYATKGDKSVTGIYPDVIQCALDSQMVHPVQKPAGIYVDLLKRSCTFGDKILDPFCGTGTIFMAASELHLTAVGIENSLDMLTFARGRMHI